jgi:hypothetical protein
MFLGGVAWFTVAFIGLSAFTNNNNHVVYGKTATEYLEEYKQHLGRGQATDALQSLSSAISLEPTNYLSRFKRAGMASGSVILCAHFSYAALYLSQGKDAQALVDLNAVLDQKPDFDQASFVLPATLTLRRWCNGENCTCDAVPWTRQSLIYANCWTDPLLWATTSKTWSFPST